MPGKRSVEVRKNNQKEETLKPGIKRGKGRKTFAVRKTTIWETLTTYVKK